MKNQIVKIILVLNLLFTVVCAQSVQQFAEIGDLKLLSGNTIEKCKLGYRTFGKLNEDSSNVIIYPTWFGGTSEGIATLIQKYSFVDSSKYFIIAIDALGNGISSSPSNYEYEDSVFNNLTISDMVNSQYCLLTKIFSKEHFSSKVQ